MRIIVIDLGMCLNVFSVIFFMPNLPKRRERIYEKTRQTIKEIYGEAL